MKSMQKIFFSVSLPLLGIMLLARWFSILEASPDLVCLVPDDYITIQSAVSDVNCDDIIIKSGTYYENVVISRSVSIAGQGMHDTIIDGENDGVVLTIEAMNTVTLSDLSIMHGLDSQGGGIENYGTLFVKDSLVSENRTANSGGAGLLNRESGIVSISNSIVLSNSAHVVGGGILNEGGAVSIRNSLIISNSAGTSGGGIHSTGISSTISISNSKIMSNSADYRGGGINSSGIGATTNITNSEISSNTAGWGAGISNDSGKLFIIDSHFISNDADQTGGAVFSSNDCEVTIESSRIISNFARNSNGGGIYNHRGSFGKCTMTISKSSIHNNSGIFGGGIANEGIMNVINSNISNNEALSGGGLFNAGTGLATIDSSTLNNNTTSSYDGGGIHNDGGAITVTNSTISNNSAEMDGGGINNEVGVATVTNSTISNNSAEMDGGGVNNGFGRNDYYQQYYCKQYKRWRLFWSGNVIGL